MSEKQSKQQRKEQREFEKLKREVTPRHLLMFLHDNGKDFISVGIDSINAEWCVTGKSIMPLDDYNGFCDFLRRLDHVIPEQDLKKQMELGTPVIAIKPGATLTEAIEGAVWFMATYIFDLSGAQPKPAVDHAVHATLAWKPRVQ